MSLYNRTAYGRFVARRINPAAVSSLKKAG